MRTWKKRDWPAETIETMIRMAKEGYTAKQIGEAIGVPRNTVIGKFLRMGTTMAELKAGGNIGPKPMSAAEAGRIGGRTRYARPLAKIRKPEECHSVVVNPPPAPQWIEPKNPVLCHFPGCRNTKQRNPRDYCATHESEFLSKKQRVNDTVELLGGVSMPVV